MEQLGEEKVVRRTAQAISYEASIANVMRRQFEQQRIEILANLDPSKITKSYTRKDYLDDLIDWERSTDDMRQAVQPTIVSILYATGMDAMQDAGLDPSAYDPFTPAIREYFQNRSLVIAEDVNAETAKQLRAALSQGVQAGLSVSELRAMVEDIMGYASMARADRIASYNVTAAQSFADIQAWLQSGVVAAKEWFTAGDERVCPGCMDMHGKRIPLEDNFFDKGETLTVDRGDKPAYKLKFSYEDIPGCPLHVSCRCVLLPVRI